MNTLPFSFSVNGLKNLSKQLTLDLIRFTPGGVSRADLARRTGLTRAAVTGIVGELVHSGLIREAEAGPTAGGRRPVLLEVNPEGGYVVGLDVGVSNVNLVLADFSTRVIDELDIAFDSHQMPDIAIEQIDENLRQLLNKAGLRLDQVKSIGVGLPGPVLLDKDLLTSQMLMPSWENFPVRARMQALWQVPVSLNSSAALGALGEWASGAGRGEQDLAYVKVGSEISTGLMLGGHLYRGTNGYAGEIGHMSVSDERALCVCGKYGCLSAVAGGIAIARQAREAVYAGRRTQLADLDAVDAITARDVANAASMGDLAAQQIVNRAGRYIGVAVAQLVNILNPGMIVIGGGISQMGDMLIEPIRQAVREHSWHPAARSVRIMAAMLGKRSTGMGAVIQALNLALPGLLEPDR
ncbi:MAG: ROK family protein [Chloroflexota bacterium]